MVCVVDGVMRDADWCRFVRRHHGYLAPDEQGDLIDGVAHLVDELNRLRAPESDGVEAANVLTARRPRRRDRVTEQWNDPQIRTGREVPVTRASSRTKEPLTGSGFRDATPRRLGSMLWPWTLGAALVLMVSGLSWWVIVILVLTGVDLLIRVIRAGRRLTGLAANVGVGRMVKAVADALQAREPVSTGTGTIVVEIRGQELRCRPSGMFAEESAGFAETLDEALQPVSRPRHLISHLAADPSRFRDVLRLGLIGWETILETQHPVPSVLTSSKGRADACLLIWRRWVGEGEVRYIRSPEDEGIT